MGYTIDEVIQFIEEEDVKFVRMAFCDVNGIQKNVSIMPSELDRAFNHGISVDASAIEGFGGDLKSDLFLFPDPNSLAVLPWRPEHGRVVRMYCKVTHPDGNVSEADTRSLLAKAVEEAEAEGITFKFGSEMEFYLFNLDENGLPTKIPYDNAGYMDIAPQDKGENVRREICLTLEQMGIKPESSHHEEGPGQNEIDFRYAIPLKAADDAITFRSVVSTIAARNGLYADFSPMPLEKKPGNGMHINFSAKKNGEDVTSKMVAGVLKHVSEMTIFLNTMEASYERFGKNKAPGYVSWSEQNRSQLIRIPAAKGEYVRAELRSPDPMCNPYLVYYLLIKAGLDGIKNDLELPEPADVNLYTAGSDITSNYKRLPDNYFKAKAAAKNSEFIKENVPASILESVIK